MIGMPQARVRAYTDGGRSTPAACRLGSNEKAVRYRPTVSIEGSAHAALQHILDLSPEVHSGKRECSRGTSG